MIRWQEEEEVAAVEEEAEEEPPEEEVQEKKRKKPISISLKGAKVCKVKAGGSGTGCPEGTLHF